jgi:hypothetical protein
VSQIPTTCWKIREEKAGFENEEEFAAGMLEWSPTDSASDESIVDELNLLLTGDRLSESHKQLIAEQMLERRNAEGGGEEEALKAAILLIASAPEFQVERNLGEEAEEERVINDGGEGEEEEEFDDDDYKAMVRSTLTNSPNHANLQRSLSPSHRSLAGAHLPGRRSGQLQRPHPAQRLLQQRPPGPVPDVEDRRCVE